jgi:hypothetical protein
MNAHYILGLHLHEKYAKHVFLFSLVSFQNCAAIEKKVTIDSMVSKHTLILISLANYSIIAASILKQLLPAPSFMRWY